MLKTSLKCYTTHVPRRLLFDIHFSVKWDDKRLSNVTLHDKTARCQAYSRHTSYRRTQLLQNGNTKNTHDEYCNTLFILGVCTSRAGTGARKFALHYPGRRHPDANVFRRLQHLLCKTLVNVSRLRTRRTPANKHVIIADVERQPRRTGTIPNEDVVLYDQLNPHHISLNGNLFSGDRAVRLLEVQRRSAHDLIT